MNLSGLKKLVSTIGTKICESMNDPHPGLEPRAHPGLEPRAHHEEERTVIVIQEKKNSVQIKCWSCGYLQWVKKGTTCHTKGLCGSCIATFDEKTDTVLTKAK